MAQFVIDYTRNHALRSVGENWNLIRSQLQEVLSRHIPTFSIASNPASPWFTRSIKTLLNKKKRLFQNATRFNTSLHWTNYHTVSNTCKHEVKNAKRKFYGHTLPDTLRSDPKKFWRVVNPKKRVAHPDLTDENGVPLSDGDAANAFNNFFSSVFTDERFPLPSFVLRSDSIEPMPPLIFTPQGISQLIENLRVGICPGEDQISSKLLKVTRDLISPVLSLFFQQSLNSIIAPADWSHAQITPILKAGPSSNPTNYRPISLTSVPCKLMEHVIYTHLLAHLDQFNFLFPNQHGFRKHHSCVTQLFEFITDLHVNTHDNHQTDIIFIDLAKAFDTVPHSRLLLKLSRLRIEPCILNWIASFLSNRTQSVKINASLSYQCSVSSGVPQGSVLGPLLFLIYVNDLPSSLTSTIRLFADDCVIYRKISDTSDHLILQNDLDRIGIWCTDWLMNINVSKSKHMNISTSPSRSSTQYFLQGRNIDRVSVYKYLGVHFSETLNWSYQVDCIVASAHKTLGFLKRNIALAPPSTKLLAYNSLILPKLEYASAVWSPHQAYLVDRLESVQNKAARFITSDYSSFTSVTSLKNNLGLHSLEKRRRLSRLCLFHTIFNSASTFRQTYCKPPSYISPRTDHQLKIQPPKSRTLLFSSSPVVMCIRDWNDMPYEVVSETNLAAYKLKCEQYIGMSS